MVLTAMTCIAAFRAVGVLLVLAFLVGPVLTARLWTNRLKTLIALSCAFGGASTLLGVALSRHFLSVYNMPLSTGGIVVALIGLIFTLSAVLTFRRDNGLIMGSYG
jgi:manganese/zinc/iron transport system permease protein